MADLYEYPEVTIEGEVYTKADLRKEERKFEKQHGIAPYALVTGHMETKQGERLYCNACYISDAYSIWFTVCHPTGTYTMRVPEHEQITLTLTTNAEE